MARLQGAAASRATSRRSPPSPASSASPPSSTRSRPPSAPTSTSPPPAPRAGCSSSPRPGQAYGVDANGDGHKDPYNPVDAICAAARYLRASGGNNDLRAAIFSYNHASWYVDEVLLYARSYGGIPSYAARLADRPDRGRPLPDRRQLPLRRRPLVRRRFTTATKAPASLRQRRQRIEASPTSRGINIFSRQGAPVVAVNDGVIQKIGPHAKLGLYMVLQDDYGNKFTYAQLGPFARSHPVPKSSQPGKADLSFNRKTGQGREDHRRRARTRRLRHQRAAADRRRTERIGNASAQRVSQLGTAPAPTPAPPAAQPQPQPAPSLPGKARKTAAIPGSERWGQLNSIVGKKVPGYSTFKGYFSQALGLNQKNANLCRSHRARRSPAGPCSPGSAVPGGVAPHINFAIGPAGRGAPRSTRSRSSTAGSCSRRRRSTAPRARTRSHARRASAGAAAVEGATRAPRPRRPAPPDLPLRAQGHPHRPDRPPGPGGDGVPRPKGFQPDDQLAEVRKRPGRQPQGLDPERRRQRDGHLGDQRRPRHRPFRAPGRCRRR